MSAIIDLKDNFQFFPDPLDKEKIKYKFDVPNIDKVVYRDLDGVENVYEFIEYVKVSYLKHPNANQNDKKDYTVYYGFNFDQITDHKNIIILEYDKNLGFRNWHYGDEEYYKSSVFCCMSDLYIYKLVSV